MKCWYCDKELPEGYPSQTCPNYCSKGLPNRVYTPKSSEKVNEEIDSTSEFWEKVNESEGG